MDAAVSGKRNAPIATTIVVVLLVGVPALAWALRGTIATSLAKSELEAQGLSCDDRFEVSLSAGLGEATVGPTRCAHEGGIVEAIELLGDMTVELDGLTPARVEVDSLRIVLRDSEVRGGSQWSSQLRRLDLEQRVAGLVKGLSEIGQMDLPPLSAAQLEVVRGGDVVGSARVLTLGEGAPTPVTAQQILFTAGPAGIGRLTLSNVTGEASASTVHLAGRADATAGIAILSVRVGGAFTLDATHLDTASPRFSLGGDF